MSNTTCRTPVHDVGLVALANAIGEAWAGELVHGFRHGQREILGPWPGTLGEARMRVLAGLRSQIELAMLADLARVATDAARHAWNLISQPDPEP